MPIYRNIETGHTVEVMSGTKLPKVYKEVTKSDAVKGPKDAEVKTTEDKSKANKTASNSGSKAKSGKSTNTGSKESKSADVPKEQDAAEPESKK